jgi:hypothetical protein
VIRKQIAILIFSVGFLLMAGIIGVLPMQTSTRVFAAGETPTPIATQPITSTQFGPFVLSRKLSGPCFKPPEIKIPSWISFGEKSHEVYYQREALTKVYDAYETLVNYYETGDPFETPPGYLNVINAVDEYLGKYTDGDVLIPVLMMLGNAHSSQYDRSPKILGHEYELAINLMLRRHPERLPEILNDLIDMGLPIADVKYIPLDHSGTRALLFTLHFLCFNGITSTRIYSLVGTSDGSWKFAALPTQYPNKEFHYMLELVTTDDINSDGLADITTESVYLYTDGIGFGLQAFNWEDGKWHDRMDWIAVGWREAWNGNFWFEDLNDDNIQEIVVSYMDAPGTFFPIIEVYQWDVKNRIYSNALPINTQVCGYHAFAEAERRRHAIDLVGAIAFYEKAHALWQSEMAKSSIPCQNFEPSEHDLSYIAEIQNELEDAVTDKNALNATFKFHDYTPLYKYIYDEATTKTGTIIQQIERENIFQCGILPCRVVGKVYQSISYSVRTPGVEYFDCRTSRYNNDTLPAQVQYKSQWKLKQIIHWECEVSDKNIYTVFRQDGPDIQTICTWNGSRFVLSSSQIVKPAEITRGDLKDYPTLLQVFQISTQLADCSGEELPNRNADSPEDKNKEP